ncbi:MAG: HAD-IIIA family hydrolase [Victivallales bacterium]|nr:HAD-IIIA family hydrolase [Victivallales bacterium]
MNWDAIKAIVLDIDGILTDGKIGYCGSTEVKFFHVRDGHGLKLAMRAGIKVGILSGRSSEANRTRAAELGLDFLYEGKKDKREAFRILLEEQNLKAEECLYMGDDVVDIPVLVQSGVAVTVADAPEIMDKYADFRTALPGGGGAVREVVERLLKEQNKWNGLMERYIS